MGDIEMSDYCPDCEQSTSLVCPKHSNYTIVYHQNYIPVKCKLCGQVINDYRPNIILPYGSKFDGEYICISCIINKIDPLIEAMSK